ncbi:hypothetical protein [Sphingomonas abietis]|uniref:Uncharacterized protein n=1 Tax=Sphingomonas abietis TaxID=3012344 RepID=A0ABY7NL74_9SPHN|nr:hypothetical protein [Sphingomonas abietis]WBO22302.1 hypothetical protein PBT88_19500 [Sphingomonas abietis]
MPLLDAAFMPYKCGMRYEDALVLIGRTYSATVVRHGGRSLSRVATILVNQGCFFHRLESGKTCTARNLERVAAHFRVPANWPNGVIPDVAVAALAQIGRPALLAA